MSIRTTIRDRVAAVHVKVAKSGLGVQVSYNPRGEGGATVWCIPQGIGNSRMRETLGTRSQEEVRIFNIAINQTGFLPTDGIMDDDVITDENSVAYAIREWSNDSLGAVYKFTGVATTPKQSGNVGQ